MSAGTVELGAVGRFGRFAATHARRVAVIWAVVAVGLGFLAPRVETALSGAGWEAAGSDSVAARSLIQWQFAGNASSALMVVVHSPTMRASDAPFAAVTDPGRGDALRATRRRRRDAAGRGTSISRDGHTAIVPAGAGPLADGDGARRRPAEGPAARARHGRLTVSLTGAIRHVVRLQRANRSAMMRSRAVLVARHARDPGARVRLARGRRACR